MTLALGMLTVVNYKSRYSPKDHPCTNNSRRTNHPARGRALPKDVVESDGAGVSERVWDSHVVPYAKSNPREPAHVQVGALNSSRG